MCSATFARIVKSVGEREHVFELDPLANRSERRVVAILFAAFGVAAGRLNVPVRGGTDPYVRPGGGHGERLHPANRLLVGEPGAVRMQIDESLARLPAPNPRPVVRYIAQPRYIGGFPRIEDRLEVVGEIEHRRSFRLVVEKPNGGRAHFVPEGAQVEEPALQRPHDCDLARRRCDRIDGNNHRPQKSQ